jgi:hypothetical protein
VNSWQGGRSWVSSWQGELGSIVVEMGPSSLPRPSPWRTHLQPPGSVRTVHSGLLFVLQGHLCHNLPPPANYLRILAHIHKEGSYFGSSFINSSHQTALVLPGFRRLLISQDSERAHLSLTTFHDFLSTFFGRLIRNVAAQRGVAPGWLRGSPWCDLGAGAGATVAAAAVNARLLAIYCKVGAADGLHGL